MYSKYSIQCLFSLILFNCVFGNNQIINSPYDEWNDVNDGIDNEINSSIDKSSIEEKLQDLQDNIINKLEGIGLVQDLIVKGNKESANTASNLESLQKKIPELENSLNRTLNIIEKIPEVLDKIIQRLDALEKAPKLEEQVYSLKNISETLPASLNNFNTKFDTLARLTKSLNGNTEKTLITTNKIPDSLKAINDRIELLEKSVQSSRRSEISEPRRSRSTITEINQYLSDAIAKNKLENEELLENEVIEMDVLDKSTFNETECRFLSLENNQYQWFDILNSSVSDMEIAYQQLSAYRFIRKVDFEKHIAIRSTENFHILLWENRKPKISGDLDPDYEISLGTTSGSSKNMLSVAVKRNLVWQEARTILSADQYKKFYIRLYPDSLEVGSSCDEPPLHVEKVLRSGNITTIAFYSKSSNGAKILYDCPAKNCAGSM